MLQEREAAVQSQRGGRVSETTVKVDAQPPADKGSGTS
jgi:hypothetical protein